jgi:hypothetical protein
MNTGDAYHARDSLVWSLVDATRAGSCGDESELAPEIPDILGATVAEGAVAEGAVDEASG